MGALDGRVAIVTGAGNGLGRAHAMRLAAEGACVVVNDLGCDIGGGREERSHAAQVVDEIRASGGQAVASTHDIADWAGAAAAVALAIESFGDLHVVVNNAGIVRDRTLWNLDEAEWDAVLRVNLKGHVATCRHALAYWRERAKAAGKVQASVVHTSSLSGYRGNFGQANYSAAKGGLIALSRVISIEAGRLGVRSNVISPSARSRMSAGVAAIEDLTRPPDDGSFDYFDPANVSPLVAWLARADCPADRQVFHVGGNDLFVFATMPVVHHLRTDGRWTLEDLDRQLSGRLVQDVPVQFFPGGPTA
jgi:NAD(P)-dependent dehydrogenase (short-subunit alcohol dehydrogenase family)